MSEVNMENSACLSAWTTGSTTDNTAWINDIYIGDPPPYQQPYIGDPIPCTPGTDWTIPYQPSPVEITPYYPYYPQKDNKEDFKKILEDMLSEKEEEKKTKIKEENLMKVFEVTVIDRRECEILHEQKVIAKDTETAMIELDLTPEIKKKARKNLIEFIFNEIGSFTKAERKVRVKDLEDEE